MLECQQCGHDVLCHFTILEKYERFWLDLDQDVVLGSGLGESSRHLRERLHAFASTWGEQTPKAVATLQRNFEQTMAFYALGGRVHSSGAD